MEGGKSYKEQRRDGVLETDLDEEFLLKDPVISSFSTEDSIPPPNYPNGQDLPDYEFPSTTSSPEIDDSQLSQIIICPDNEANSTPESPSVSDQYWKPFNVTTTIFSFVLTAAFICIVWLVVFMIFGYKGHAIAGVFIVLCILGLLINTCFLKLYFRFRVFLGLSTATAIAHRHALQRQQRMTQLALEKSAVQPPSYANAVASPPPYSFLQYYRSKKSSMASVTSSAINSRNHKSTRRKQKCPFCKREVRVFGICLACKSDLIKK